MTGPPDANPGAAGAATGAQIVDQAASQIERENIHPAAAVKPLPSWRRPPEPKPTQPMAIAIWGAWRIFATDEPLLKRGTAACSRCGAAHEISLAGDLPRCGCLATRRAWR